MTRLLISFIFITILTFSACTLLSVKDGTSSVINIEELIQHWEHSYEEELEGSDVKVYRPHDYKEFPPSRFRMQYIFEEADACQWYYLAPDDGHHFKSGKWKLDAENSEVLIIEQGEDLIRYRIMELNKEVLRMKFIDTE